MFVEDGVELDGGGATGLGFTFLLFSLVRVLGGKSEYIWFMLMSYCCLISTIVFQVAINRLIIF